MSKIKMSAGDSIESRCTKCRKITNHTIVALKDNKPAKVECNTCKGQHLYRKPKAAPQTAATRAANAKLAEQKKWIELQSQLKEQGAKEYSMDEKYKINSVIKHTKFGLGQVQCLTGTRKMEVLFEDGLKKMRCK